MKFLKLLDELESAIPDMRDALEANPDYMAEGDDESAEPPMPEDMEADEEAAEGEELPPSDAGDEDMMVPPPFLPKKKKAVPPF